MDQKETTNKRNLNLKFGDVIFLKSYFQLAKGVVAGDGIASNKLECVKYLNLNKDINLEIETARSVKSKVGNLIFQKCLFRIEPAKKYIQQEKLKQNQEEGTTKIENEFQTKIDEEIKENERLTNLMVGTNVSYGQDIQLIHLYSNCVLTLNYQVLAKQNCCRELSLEEFPNSYSNFKILSVNKAKQAGEPVLYGDQIIIGNSFQSSWQLGIQKPLNMQNSLQDLNDGLEVNATENPQPLKLCYYMDHKVEQESRNPLSRGRFLQSGDIIRIKNRALGGFLSIKRESFITSKLKERIVQFKDAETKGNKPQVQHYFDILDLKKQTTINSLYKLYVDTNESNSNSLNNLWQVQLRDGLKQDKCTYEKDYLIKHVSTGCFLQILQDKLILTYNGTEKDCIFQLKSKKGGHEFISYNESIKIINSNLVIVCKKSGIQTQNKNEKTDIQQSMFLFKPVNESLSLVANRISSLQTYLLQFYLYLQDWGMVVDKKGSPILEYDYFKSFNNQKTLYDEIQQLFQSLENLTLFLTNDNQPQSSEEQQQNQKAVQENDIINLLIAILKLVHFMIYGNSKEQNPDQPKENIIPDKSPQKIAKLKLDPLGEKQKNCIKEIYKILQLCVQSSSSTSDFIFQLKIFNQPVLLFLLQQLKFYRKEVSDLLKETVRYTEMNDDSTSGNLEKWIQELKDVNDENIEDQTLFIELLSLMMIDPFENPNQVCQDQCRKLLFKKINKDKSQSLISFGLIDQKNSSVKIPYVQFNYTTGNEDIKFQLYNQMFCTLYHSYLVSSMHTQVPLNRVSINFFTTNTLKNYHIDQAQDYEKIYQTFWKYEQYVLAVLNLYSSLCKGRNYKSIEMLRDECKIDGQFLYCCFSFLHSNQHQLRFERSIMNLYINLQLDIDPLTPISRFQNNSFVYEEVRNFDSQKHCSGQLFYEQSISSEMKERFQSKQDDKTQISLDYQILKKYAQTVLNQVNEGDDAKKNPLKEYINMFREEKLPQIFTLDDAKITSKIKEINYVANAQYQLEYFLSLLNIIKISVDLGYNDLETNTYILDTLPNILIVMIIQQSAETKLFQFNSQEDYQKNQETLKENIEKNEIYKKFYSQPNLQPQQGEFVIFNQKPWMLQLLMWTTCMVNDELLCMKIYLEAIKILKTLIKLKKHLCVVDYLRDQINKNESRIDKAQIAPSVSSRFDKKSNTSRQGSLQSIAPQKIDVYQEYGKLDIKKLLFECLYTAKGRNQLIYELMETLVQMFKFPTQLCEEIQKVELIDNSVELDYFATANGNSKDQDWLSPKEAQLTIRRLIKLYKLPENEGVPMDLKQTKRMIQNGEFQDKNQQKIATMQKLHSYLNAILMKFENVKQDDQNAFQNIIRNAGIHKVFIELVTNVGKVISDKDIVLLFRKVIQFYILFSVDNNTNIQELQQYIGKLLQVATLEQEQATDLYYHPINVVKLIIQLLQQSKGELKHQIDQIFSLISQCYKQIKTKLFKRIRSTKQEDLIKKEIEEEEEEFDAAKNIVLINAIKQYIKILKSLTQTFTKPADPLQANKHQILTFVLKSQTLKGLIEPLNFYQNIIIPDQEQYEDDSDKVIKFHQLKLHAAMISLITDCCKFDRLAIQEMQRVLSYEQLKTILLNIQGAYIVKRSYLMCLFELYINRVRDGNQFNETIDADEIRDVLSRVIIPELDQKQIMKYLEGLARLRLDESGYKVESKQLRESIIVQKQQHAQKEIQQFEQVDNQLILRDSSEFWRYIRKNAIIHFLVFTYDEKKDLIDKDTKSEESTLSDEFAIIKQSVQKIKSIFNKLERDYRMKKEDLDLDIYRDLITSLEEIIPQRKITKFGQNYRINNSGNELNVHTSNTLKDDQGVDKKIQDQGDNVQRLDIVYQRNVKIFLIRYNATIQNVIDYFRSKWSKADIVKITDVFKRNDKVYLSEGDVKNLSENEVDKIRKQQTINSKVVNNNDEIYFKQALIELFGKKQNPQYEETLRVEQLEKKKNDQILQEAIKEFPKEVSNQINYQVTTMEKKYLQYQKNQEEEQELIKKDNERDDQTEEVRLNSEADEDTEPSKQIDVNLSEDKQILILILNLEMESCDRSIKILNFDKLDVFITRCTNIFLGQEVYLIKIARILLEKNKPTKDEIEQLDQRKEKEEVEETKKIEQIESKYKKFKTMQTDVCLKSQLDQTAMQQLSTQEGKQYLQYEVVSLLVTLLEFGNQKVQQQIFEAFKSNYRLKNLFIQFLRKLFAQDIQGKKGVKTQHSTFLKNEQIKLGIKVLRLLQLLCENVNLDFQKFLTVQNENDQYSSNVNIIAETQNYLAEVIDDKSLDDKLRHELVRQGIETLVEYTTGVDQNRIEICKNQRFFQLIQRMFPAEMMKGDNKDYFRRFYVSTDKKLQREKYNNFQLLLSYVKLIQTLVQGNPQRKQLEFVYHMFNVDSFIIIAEKIYHQRIQDIQDKIELDLICNNHGKCLEYYCSENYKTDEDQILLLLGFSIFIICYQMTDVLEGDEFNQLFPFKFDGKDEELDINAKKILPQPTSEEQGQKLKYQQVLPEDEQEDVNEQFTQNKTFGIDSEILNSQKFIEKKREKTRKSTYFKFYRSYIGRVELQNSNDQLEKVYFQIPFVKKFMTPNIKNHIIYGSNRDTDEDRIQSLILNHQFYLKQMEHNQSIQERPFVKFGANYWRLLKDISFCLCFVIVLLLLFMHDTVINSKIASSQEAPEDTNVTDFERFVSYLNNIITIIQLVLNLIIIIFCAIERYPISITYRQGETNAFKIVSLKKEAGFEIPRLNQIYHSLLGAIENLFESKNVQDSWFKKLILIFLLDFDNFYNLCIFGLTVYAFFNPYVYVILLLDIIKRSEDLQNIIKSITQNGQNLIIFSFLGGIGLTIYGVLCFNYFNEGLGSDDSQSFILSVTTVINKGLRNGGGIGDVLDDFYSDDNKIDPDSHADRYWGYYFLTFTFYIIFNILFINIIFGIILDTFGQLRDERQELIKEIEEKCFVCSLERNQIDSKGKTGWYQHIYLEHNVYHMLFYIIYVKKKNTNECNRLEKHVKECIEEEPSPSTDFFPKNAIQMLDEQQD